MYAFLSCISFLNICYSTCWESYVLVQCLPTISYTSCYALMTTSLFLGMTKCILAVLVYDRFVAFSRPLCHTIIMNNWVCIQLALKTWANAFLVTVTTLIAIHNCYCAHSMINHFTCDIQALLKLVCSDTHVSLIPGLDISVFTLSLLFTFILISYFHFVVAVLRICSVKNRLKAFSTCGSHI